MNIYTDHTAWVRTPEGDTPTFQPTAGVLQGDTLAPFLFDLVVDCILHKCYADLASIKPGIPLRHGSLTDLDYADDIALISRGMGEAQITLLHCQAIALSAGLEMNASKTKYIVLGRDRQRPPLQLNNAPLEAVTDFRYLGSYLDDDADFTARRGQAWEIVNRCKPVWNSPCVSRENKRRLFRTLVEPILLYSAPSYSMTDGRARRLDGCCTRMLKIVQNYIPTDHIPLATIYEDLPLLSSSCILRQLRAVLSTFASLPDHPLCELLLHPLGHTLVAARRWTLRATISANWSLPLTDIPMYAHGAFEDFISSRAYAHEVQTRRNVMYRSTRKSLSKDFACIVQQNAPSLSGDEDTPLNATPLASIRGLPRLEQQVAFLASIRPDLISLSFLTPLNLHKSSPTPDIRPLTPPAATSAASVTVTISATRATRPPEASDTISPLTAVSITSDSMLVASKSYTICAQTQDAAAIATCEILSEFPLVSFTFATSFKMFPKHRRMYRRQNRKHIVWKSLYRLILDRDATLIHTTFIQAPRPPRPRREESESA